MTDLTAAEVQALAALMRSHPMTSLELVRAVTDAGMHLDSAEADAALASLAAQGLAEPTPAASLGKYRITASGRARIASGGALS